MIQCFGFEAAARKPGARVGPEWNESRLNHAERHGMGHRHATLTYTTTIPANHFPHPPEPPLVVWQDSREQTPVDFSGDPNVRVEVRGLPIADYTTESLFGTAAIERKSGADFVHSITNDRDRFMRELVRLSREYDWKCVAVDTSFSRCVELTRAHPHALAGTVASLLADFDVPCIFLDTPRLMGLFVAGTLRRWEARMAKRLPELTMAGQLAQVAERMGLVQR